MKAGDLIEKINLISYDILKGMRYVHKISTNPTSPFFQPVLPRFIELFVVALDHSKSSFTGFSVVDPFSGQHLQNDQSSVTLCCHPEVFGHVSCRAAGFQGWHQWWEVWEAGQGEGARSASFINLVADSAQ